MFFPVREQKEKSEMKRGSRTGRRGKARPPRPSATIVSVAEKGGGLQPGQVHQGMGGKKWVAGKICTSKLWLGFPGGSDSRESACKEGHLGLMPGWEDPLEEGMATYSSTFVWRSLMDRGA